MITKICECGIRFEYEPPKNYPDNRKYCDKCADRKKAEWDARQNPTAQPVPVNPSVEKIPSTNGIAQETGNFQSTVWNHTVAANSYEWGKADNRHKVYYETIEELEAKVKAILSSPELNLFVPEHVPHD